MKKSIIAVTVTVLSFWTVIAARDTFTSRRIVHEFEQSPTPSACTSLTQTAKALKVHLESEGSELTVVLLPFLSAFYPPVEPPAPRELQLKPNPQTDALFGTAADLRREGIEVLTPLECLLPLLTPTCDGFSPDGHHYSLAAEQAVAREIQRHARSRGNGPRGSLVVAGDSYAGRIAAEIRTVPRLKAVHRAGSSNRIAFQLSQLPDDYIEPGSHIYWIVTSSYLNEQTVFPPWTPKATSTLIDGRVVGMLLQSTPMEGPKLLTSPYSDALAAYKFQPEQGEPILVIGQVMKERKLTAIFYWYAGVRMNVQLLPWEEAELRHKELKTMQLLDAIGDPTLPAYFADDFIYFSE